MRSTLRLTIGPGQVRGERLRWALRQARVSWTAEATYTGAADLADVIAQLVAEPALRRIRRVEVCVVPPIVQLRRLEGLPPVRATALGALVAHQAARFFRRNRVGGEVGVANGSPLVTDAVWPRVPFTTMYPWRRGPRAARVAHAAAIEAPWIEAILAGTQAAGLTVTRIRPAGAEPQLRRLQLVPPVVRTAARRAALLGLRQLAALTLALWLAVGVAEIARLRQASQQTNAELAALAAPLAAVSAARHQVREARAMVTAVAADEARRGRVTATLGRIAAALPDSAYLTALTLTDDGAGVMTGHARRAADVVAAVERTGAVSGPRLDGAGSRMIAGGREWEPFSVRFGAAAPGTAP